LNDFDTGGREVRVQEPEGVHIYVVLHPLIKVIYSGSRAPAWEPISCYSQPTVCIPTLEHEERERCEFKGCGSRFYNVSRVVSIWLDCKPRYRQI